MIERLQLQGDAASSLRHPHWLADSSRHLGGRAVTRLLLFECKKYGEAKREIKSTISVDTPLRAKVVIFIRSTLHLCRMKIL